MLVQVDDYEPIAFYCDRHQWWDENGKCPKCLWNRMGEICKERNMTILEAMKKENPWSFIVPYCGC